uniref:aluminum-activated malate transporter 8-like n=1 Tax=Erigeron canadensis TaxID=72917 RepID=UPI001CB93CDD|nr:aluminum-activated malate transporter 8-like [Erigeron canadensis]
MENASSPSPITPFTNLIKDKAKTIAIAFASKIKHVIIGFAQKIKKTKEDDPRRISHSLKVAFAITLVSMVYYLQPFYNGMGDAGMWAILTVVVVFEYTVGATLSKGMNRGFATLLAGALGVGAEAFAGLFGPTVKPVVLGCFVFLLVSVATFSRFIPNIKKRYDYGVLIFILTFTLVAVSGYRVEKIIALAHQRLSTIIFGGTTCIIISMCVCPVWAGEDLHKLIVVHLEKLSIFLEGFGGEYYKIDIEGDKSFLTAYKSVLNSKATEESLANFAWWEIAHGKFRFRHPWKQYLEIGVYTRQCAYHIEALNGYLDAKDEAPSEFQKLVQEPCTKMSSEVGKALRELGASMKLMIHPSTSSAVHIENCKKAVEELNSLLQASTLMKSDIKETIPVIAVISILFDIIKCVETMSDAIQELCKQARFKKPEDIECNKNEKQPNFLLHGGAIKPEDGLDEENKETITLKVLLDDRIIPQDLELGKSKRDLKLNNYT